MDSLPTQTCKATKGREGSEIERVMSGRIREAWELGRGCSTIHTSANNFGSRHVEVRVCRQIASRNTNVLLMISSDGRLQDDGCYDMIFVLGQGMVSWCCRWREGISKWLKNQRPSKPKSRLPLKGLEPNHPTKSTARQFDSAMNGKVWLLAGSKAGNLGSGFGIPRQEDGPAMPPRCPGSPTSHSGLDWEILPSWFGPS